MPRYANNIATLRKQRCRSVVISRFDYQVKILAHSSPINS
ncbi:hypothetical protein HMPREF0673_01854 [Leyella stercorea DSM 18206]|uniref:Uncharacterized protein n=1 Tax=Leyella stercorea DSM 18206 TaxID=1002367 RepID=G6AYZ2_9BACT|nr:hypothetical protein HMPREF0673_01854 [Leyella stercorea DSM 18206]